MQTYGTGKGFPRVPATLNPNTPENPDKRNLLISTERLVDLVLLRIDKVEAKDVTQLPQGRDE